jgi:hypothetical protein
MGLFQAAQGYIDGRYGLPARREMRGGRGQEQAAGQRVIMVSGPSTRINGPGGPLRSYRTEPV